MTDLPKQSDDPVPSFKYDPPIVWYKYYGWKVVFLGSFILAIINGPLVSGGGTFFVALERQYKWSRTVLSGAVTLSRAEGAFFGPVEGYLADRLGARRVILLGFTILALGWLWFSQTNSVFILYGAYIVMAFGSGITGWVPMMQVVNNWFSKRRGIAMAITLSGFSVGGLLVPLVAWGIDTIGWRNTALVMAATIAILALPSSLAMRNRPQDYGQFTADEFAPQKTGQYIDPDAGLTAKQAMKTSSFWIISACHAIASMGWMIVTVHIVPLLTDKGISLQMASLVVGVFTTVGMISQLVGGFLADRMSHRLGILLFCISQAFSMLIIAYAEGTVSILIFSVLFGIGYGGRSTFLSAIRGDYFGRKAFGTIIGISLVPMTICMVLGPLIIGNVFDRTGDYTTSFIVTGILTALGGFSIILAKRPQIS